MSGFKESFNRALQHILKEVNVISLKKHAYRFASGAELYSMTVAGTKS
jgi:hypothetical protein